ncbi:MAG: hypothetical protein J6M92_14600 [Oribacterium sp.]|nr:hypothetical protein [Oribacterium sp.]
MAKVNTVSRGTSRQLDIVHIILGVIIVVMAIMAFINPVENMVLFPLIFFVAAVLKFISGVSVIMNANSEHDRRVHVKGSLQIIIGVIILGIGIISAVSIWF